MQLSGQNKSRTFSMLLTNALSAALMPPVNAVIYSYMDYVMSASGFFLQQIHCNCKLLMQLKGQRKSTTFTMLLTNASTATHAKYKHSFHYAACKCFKRNPCATNQHRQ
jgi:hypothetical protein